MLFLQSDYIKKIRSLVYAVAYRDAIIESIDYENKVILPLSNSTSIGWILYRLFKIENLNQCSVGTLKNIVSSIDNMKKQLAGLIVMPSFLYSLCEKDYDLLKEFIQQHDIELFTDFYPEGSGYNFTAKLDALDLHPKYFGPQIDNAQKIPESDISSNNVLKHFGFGGSSQSLISSSHDKEIRVDDISYQLRMASELKRYKDIGACQKGGLMIAHIYNTDKKHFLIEDVSLLQSLQSEGCTIYSDSFSMIDLIHRDLSITQDIILVFTDFWQLLKYRSKIH